MFSAFNSQGKLIDLHRYSLKEVQMLRKYPHYCPQCKHPVMLRSGPKVIPHFAHVPNSTCPSASNGEGNYHHQGKHQLFLWLDKQGFQPRLEYYLKEIQQRPDILFHYHKKWIAIEFQCARVEPEEIIKRTEGLKKVGITPIWILGENRLKLKKANRFSFSSFHALFLFGQKHNAKLLFYNPSIKVFKLIHSIFPSSTNHAYGSIHQFMLEKTLFIDLFRPFKTNKSELLNYWLKEKQSFRTRYYPYQSGHELTYRKWLYQKQIHPSLLPSVIHLPTPSHFQLSSPVWHWQSKLILEVVGPLKVGQRLSLEKCRQVLKGDYQNQNLLPNLQRLHDPMEEYLRLLIRLEYLDKDLIKRKEIVFPKSLEQGLRLDVEVIGKLKV